MMRIQQLHLARNGDLDALLALVPHIQERRPRLAPTCRQAQLGESRALKSIWSVVCNITGHRPIVAAHWRPLGILLRAAHGRFHAPEGRDESCRWCQDTWEQRGWEAGNRYMAELVTRVEETPQN